MPLSNGETFAGYRIVRLLGSGGTLARPMMTPAAEASNVPSIIATQLPSGRADSQELTITVHRH
jgi:hypothetical protein